MICIYDGSTDDWTGNGLCILQPTSCTVNEVAGGEYELELVHPMTDDLRWTQIQHDYIIKAPVPAARTPALTVHHDEIAGTTAGVEYSVKTTYTYYTTTSSGSSSFTEETVHHTNHPIYWAVMSSPLYGKMVDRIQGGETVIGNGDTYNKNRWIKVTTPRNITGWVDQNAGNPVLTKIRDIPAEDAVAAYDEIIPSKQSSYQCFRIYNVEVDAENHKVTANARHISYDFVNTIVGEWNIEDATKVPSVLETMKTKTVTTWDDDFELLSNRTGTSYTGDLSYQNGIYCLLDPDDGIVPKTKSMLFRDNKTFYILPNSATNRGVKIAYGKNLLGVTWTKNVEDVITRLIPLGEDKDGNKFLLPEKWIDSSHINEYPTVRVQTLEVDDAKIADKTSDKAAVTQEDCYTLMRDKANEEFTNGCDLMTLELEVDFINIGDTEEYKQYKDLQQVYLYDTINITHAPSGFSAEAQVSEYEWDAILCRYNSIKIGDVFDVSGSSSVTGYQLSSGSVTSAKISDGSVTTGKIGSGAVTTGNLRDLSVTNAKIGYAAITSANIASAAITEANIADASITNAKIVDATIDKAKIKDFTAEVGTIAEAKISSATIDAANITNLSTKVMDAVEANIETANIDWADIDTLNTATAKIADARIGVANIDFSQVNSIDTETFNAKTSSVNWQTVGRSNTTFTSAVEALISLAYITRLFTSDLILVDNDGKLKRISIDESGDSVKVEEVEFSVSDKNITDGSIDSGKIANGTINADNIDTEAVFKDSFEVLQTISDNVDASSIAANALSNKALTASKIFGSDELDASDAVGNISIGNSGKNLRQIVASVDEITTFIDFEGDGIHFRGRYVETDDSGVEVAKTGNTEVHISDKYIQFYDENKSPSMRIEAHTATTDNIVVNNKMNVGTLSTRVMNNGSISEMWEV